MASRRGAAGAPGRLFDGRRPLFEQAHVNGHTFWRVRTAGFTSVTEAARFCDDVRAQGAACTVAFSIVEAPSVRR